LRDNGQSVDVLGHLVGGEGMTTDHYHGSSSHHVIFRNLFSLRLALTYSVNRDGCTPRSQPAAVGRSVLSELMEIVQQSGVALTR
jgi:hypothetical protein